MVMSRRPPASLPGGISVGGRQVYSVIPIGSVPASMLGTDTAAVLGTQYLSEIFIPRRVVIHSIGWLNGSNVAGNATAAVWYLKGKESTGQTTSQPCSGVNSFQTVSLATNAVLQGPGTFWCSIMFDNTSQRFRTIANGTYRDVRTLSFTGNTYPAFQRPFDLGIPSIFVADVGPIMYVVEEVI